MQLGFLFWFLLLRYGFGRLLGRISRHSGLDHQAGHDQAAKPGMTADHRLPPSTGVSFLAGASAPAGEGLAVRISSPSLSPSRISVFVPVVLPTLTIFFSDLPSLPA